VPWNTPLLPQRWAARLRGLWPRASAAAYLLAAIACCILPIAAWTAWQAYSEVRRDREAIEASLAQSAAALAQAVDSELASSMQALKVLSQSGFFQQDRVRSLGRLLHGRPRRDWDSVVVLDRDGAVLIDTAPARASAAETARLKEVHQQVQAGQAPAVLRAGKPGAKGSVLLAIPVLNDGQLRYVLGARMANATWTRLAADAAKPPGAVALLLDAQGEPIGRAAVESGGEPPPHYIASHEVPMARWQARVALPIAPVDEKHRARLLAALVPAGLSLLAGMLLALVVGWRLVGPLRRLADPDPLKPAGETGREPVRELESLREQLRPPPAEPGGEAPR